MSKIKRIVGFLGRSQPPGTPLDAPEANEGDAGIEKFGVSAVFTPEQVEPTADIVFIHGLGGHAYRTWYREEAGIYWPRDLLAKDMKDCRILTYGYEAKGMNLVGGVSINTRSDHAMKLVRDLADYRRNTQSVERRIFFVVHSLGGLVLKDALRLSESSNDAHHQQIEQMTAGIIFLGTPHRGSNLANFPATVLRVFKIFRVRTNPQIVASLSLNNRDLLDLSAWFDGWIERRTGSGPPVSIAAFYEELTMGFDAVVVSKESATIDGQEISGIYANHKDMVRFSASGTSHTGYVAVHAKLDRYIAAIRNSNMEAGDESLRKDCKQSLYSTELQTRYEIITQEHPGTLNWIWSNSVFREWLTAAEGIFWVTGKPGSGKSTLMKKLSLSKRLERKLCAGFESQKVIKAAYFFDHRSADATPIAAREAMLKSILFQLLHHEDRFLGAALPVFRRLRELNDAAPWSLPYLEETIFKIVESFEPSASQARSRRPEVHDTAICLLIDGVDEFSGEAVTILQFFKQLVSLSNGGLAICFSSRPSSEVEHQLGGCGRLEMDSHTHHDIQLYIAEKCQALLGHPKHEYRNLVNMVNKRSSGVFLWVRLICDILGQGLRLGHTPARLEEEITSSTPSDLSTLYRRILDRIVSEGDLESQSVLAITASAKEEITVIELRCVLAYGSDLSDYEPPTSGIELSDNEKSEEEIERMTKKIKSLCHGLVEARPVHRPGKRSTEFVVVLLHETLRAFLSSPSASFPPGSLVLERAVFPDTMSYGNALLLRATTTFLCQLGERDLPYGRQDFVFLPDNPDEPIFFTFRDLENPEEDESVPTSKWSTTVAAIAGPRNDFDKWCRRFDFLRYATSHWPSHAAFIDNLGHQLAASSLESMQGLGFRVWREISWELRLSQPSTRPLLSDMPGSLLELACATGCNRYVMDAIGSHISSSGGLVYPCGRLLLAAIRGGGLTLAQTFIERFSRELLQDDLYDQILPHAIDFSRTDVVQCLLDNGFDPSKETQYRVRISRRHSRERIRIFSLNFTVTPLELAILLHEDRIAQMLITHRRTRSRAVLCTTALSKVLSLSAHASSISQAGIKLLLRHGAETGADHPSSSPLGRALVEGYYEIASLLLEFGADPNLSSGGVSLLSWALTREERTAGPCKWLIEHGARVDIKALEAVFRMQVLKVKTDFVDILLEAIDRDNGYGGSLDRAANHLIDGRSNLLHLAISSNQPEVVKKALGEHNADPNLADCNGNRPIHLALGTGEQSAIQYLRILDHHGANLHMRNGADSTILQMALRSGYEEVVTNLVSMGICVHRGTFMVLQQDIETCIRKVRREYMSIDGSVEHEEGTFSLLSTTHTSDTHTSTTRWLAQQNSNLPRIDTWMEDDLSLRLLSFQSPHGRPRGEFPVEWDLKGADIMLAERTTLPSQLEVEEPAELNRTIELNGQLDLDLLDLHQALDRDMNIPLLLENEWAEKLRTLCKAALAEISSLRRGTQRQVEFDVGHIEAGIRQMTFG